MSENSLPPTDFRSKSSSCHQMYGVQYEDNQPAVSALDQLQRQVEEELRHSDRLIIAADDLIAESKGSIARNYCRSPSRTEEGAICFPVPSRPATAPEENCMPSCLSASFCDEEMWSQLPPPPQPIRCESPEPSQRETRFPPLERAPIKSRAASPLPRTYPTAERALEESRALKKKMAESSNYPSSEVNFSKSSGLVGRGFLDETKDKGRPPVDVARRHDGKEPGRSFHDGKEPGLSFHDGKEPGLSFHDGKEPGRSFHDGKEPGRSFHDGKEPGRPFHDGEEPGRPFHDGKEPGRPFHDGKEPGRSFHDGKEPGCSYHDSKETGRSFLDGKDPGRSFNNGKSSGGTFHETGDRSPVNQIQSFAKDSKTTPSAVGRAKITSVPPAPEITKPSLRAFSPSKDRASIELNESRREIRETPSRPYSRGSRKSSSDFASTSAKNITVPESGQPAYHTARSLSPFCGQTPVFSDCGEDRKLIKTEHDPHSHHDHHYYASPQDILARDEKTTAALCHLSQLRKTPSCYRCEISQGTEFLKVCCPKDSTRTGGKIVRLPKKPCLPPEDIDDLIKCETKDVESAWYLISDKKKNYKRPCPKKQKAQIAIKTLVQTHAPQICGAPMYSPLEHADPEDISPEVAAAMMFSQEQGARLDECPNTTIARLFPEEPKPQFPEKLPQGNISVVDPGQNDQDEMIEKSAAVPSEGVSDSAYTRTMKEKREETETRRSYDIDFAIGQTKREYVLVTQKPQRVNKIQFRGGNSPSWFPGYLSAFPDDEGGLKVMSSPSEIFHKAWVYSNPGNIPSNDIIVLE